MPRTPSACGGAGLGVGVQLQSRTSGSSWRARPPRSCGAIARQGPHHGAQTSSSSAAPLVEAAVRRQLSAGHLDRLAGEQLRAAAAALGGASVLAVWRSIDGAAGGADELAHRPSDLQLARAHQVERQLFVEGLALAAA